MLAPKWPANNQPRNNRQTNWRIVTESMKKFARRTKNQEACLLEKLQTGDAVAIDEWVRTHHATLIHVATAIVGDRYAEEVAQDAWLSALGALESFEGRSSLKTWLVQITANAARSRARRENRYVGLDTVEQRDDTPEFDRRGHWQVDRIQWQAETPEDLLSSQQLAEQMQQALDTLPSNQRAVMTLIDIEGIDKDEVCNILAISASHMRVLLHRARSRLYQVVNDYQETL